LASHRQPKTRVFPSLLAPGYSVTELEETTGPRVCRLYSPFVQADPTVVIKNKTKQNTKKKEKKEKKNTKEKKRGTCKADSDSERTKGESDFTLLSLHVKGPRRASSPYLAADK
jgi:hypothetical protein